MIDPNKSEPTKIYIQWNRVDGDFVVYIVGPPVHYQSMEALMVACLAAMKHSTDSEGYCQSVGVTGLPDEELNEEEDKEVSPKELN